MSSAMRQCCRLLSNGQKFLTYSVWRAAQIQQRPEQLYSSTSQTESSAELPQSGDELKLSDSCIKQLKAVNADGQSFLRVFVEGGGCSGFQYKFQLDSEINEDDRIFECNGARVVTDKDSLQYLRGSTVDYQEELIRSAFRIIDNPQAEHGCSCGASFNVKL